MLKEKIFEITNVDKLKIFSKNYVILFAILIIFYKNFLIAFLLSFLSLLKYKSNEEKVLKERKQKFLYQFKEFMHNYLISLSSGDICDTGLNTSLSDLSKIYKENDYIIIFLKEIITGQKLGISICNSFERIANELEIDEVTHFVQAFIVCYKSGGDIISLLKNNIKILESKFEMQEKIKEIFSEKKYEMKIISLMPCFMILILNLTANEYMEVFYTNITGYIVLTIAITLNIIGLEISDRMTKEYE